MRSVLPESTTKSVIQTSNELSALKLDAKPLSGLFCDVYMHLRGGL